MLERQDPSSFLAGGLSPADCRVKLEDRTLQCLLTASSGRVLYSMVFQRLIAEDTPMTGV